MIKLNLKFSDKFKEEYFEYCYNEIISDKIDEIRMSLPDNENSLFYFNALFNKCSIREILFCPAEDLEKIIETFFKLFPVLAERYHYSYLLNKVSIPRNCMELSLQDEEQKSHFDSIVDNTILELEKLTKEYDLVVTQSHINDLRQSTISRYNKKKVLCRLENAKRGNSILTRKYIDMFPLWVNSLETVFDYNIMAKKYGYDLACNADTSICAYCGLENIQTYNNEQIQVRPELDHFYPKSRFPFLALSLFNLIPAGLVCNQRHKRNTPMIGYMHPSLDSLQNNTFFTFSFLDGSDVQETLKVGVAPQHNFKDNNISLFKIQALYEGSEELRYWYSCLHHISEFHKSNGDDLSAIDFTAVTWRHTIRLDAPATKVSAQQFKVDAINDLFGTYLCSFEQ
ncbi:MULTISPECIES: hypothetical protein [Vibrio]|uniref:hypothetical protein n=1 Tax=Vibrio TaxID=662 RepID=UPI002269C5C6|nr:hypothetical protein [Vibrio parahaemolyticus]EGQ9807872.1 hypothetical protein [Vibrio parahaemolyticus]EJS9800368.1 hypothetical protein [Vibrio parahaemolyticus]MCX8766308.1 hypothetical protein [Vibrio parahaemolyticus]MCX8781096.1 hypothetical protein [Vibrio parahaemolyticus]HCG7092783.1 hypothetical protein [Vibrio parahaemolyticus]